MSLNYRGLEDHELLRLIANGDHDALGVLYDRYGRLVYSVAFASVGRAEVAAEIVQDVFMRIWEKAGTYKPDQGKVITWLASITRYRAIDVLRRLKVRPESNLISWEIQNLHLFEENDPHPIEDAVELSMQRQRVRAALAQLPENQRMVLAYAYFQGYTNSEIAELIHEPLGTVKTRIRLGMQKLRAVMLEERITLDKSEE
jgi:RNA polymerase sigma-70 factor (ECF subfamily)